MIKSINLDTGPAIFTRLVAGYAVFLGSLLFCGAWIFGWQKILLLDPSYAPMQMNTAVCLAALGLAFANLKRRKLVTYLSIFSLFLSGYTLINYTFGRQSFIDQFFAEYFLPSESVYPGRMSVNTSLGILMVSIALIISLRAYSLNKILSCAIMSSIMAVLGSISFVGYMLDYELAYGWENLTAMALMTSLAFIFFGGALSYYFWRTSKDYGIDIPSWDGFFVFLVGFTVTILSYQSALNMELKRVKEQNERAADHFRDIIQTKIEARGNAIVRMARRWIISSAMPIAQWYDDVSQLLDDLPGIEAIGKTDAEGKISIVGKNSEVNYDNIEEIRAVSKKLRATKADEEYFSSFHLTDAFKLEGGRVVFSVVTPILINSKFDGVVFAIFNIEKLFESAVDKEIILPDFNFSIIDAGYNLYTRFTTSRSMYNDVISLRSIELGYHDWLIFVNPNTNFIEERRYNIASQMLIGGLAISLLLAVMVYLFKVARMSEKESQLISDSLQSILDGSTRVSIIATDLNGMITLFNVGAEKMLGFESHEIVGKRSALSFHLKKELQENQNEILAMTGKNLGQFEALTNAARLGLFEERDWRYIRKNQTQVPVSLIVTAIRQEDEIVGFLEIAVDVTRTELRLKKYAKQLERTNSELEEFSYVASHDLKEPVRNLVSYSKLLEDDLGDNLTDDAADDLFYIKDAAKRMATLVDDLLHLSRAGRGELTLVDVDLNKVLEDTKDSINLCIEEAGAEVRARSKLPTIKGDKTLLTQLFSNLITNAIKFVEKDVTPVIWIEAMRENKNWVLKVEDNGIGMKKEYLQQIFLPFKRLHGMNKYQGTGIGLSICRKIVDRHNGAVYVDSEPGKGSTFVMTFPIKGEV